MPGQGRVSPDLGMLISFGRKYVFSDVDLFFGDGVRNERQFAHSCKEQCSRTEATNSECWLKPTPEGLRNNRTEIMSRFAARC